MSDSQKDEAEIKAKQEVLEEQEEAQ